MRRYAPIAPSKGTQIPKDVRRAVLARDRFCVCERAGFPAAIVEECLPFHFRSEEQDHVRNGGMGLKSRSTLDNLVLLAPIAHRWKTEHGRLARPMLLAYLERVQPSDHVHVEPVPGCAACYEVWG